MYEPRIGLLALLKSPCILSFLVSSSLVHGSFPIFQVFFVIQTFTKDEFPKEWRSLNKLLGLNCYHQANKENTVRGSSSPVTHHTLLIKSMNATYCRYLSSRTRLKPTSLSRWWGFILIFPYKGETIPLPPPPPEQQIRGEKIKIKMVHLETIPTQAQEHSLSFMNHTGHLMRILNPDSGTPHTEIPAVRACLPFSQVRTQNIHGNKFCI